MENSKNPKPLITHIITGLGCGGAERQLFTLLTQGLGDYYRSNVISLTGPSHYAPLLKEAGIPVTCLNSHRIFYSINQVREVLRAEPPQILQGWMYHGNLCALFSTCLTKSTVKLVWNLRVSLDGPKLLRFGTRLVNFACAKTSNFPTKIIHNSFKGRVTHEAFGYAKSQGIVIPNGFDLTRWYYSDTRRTQARELMQLDARCAIGFVGRGDPQKDVPNLMKAFLKLLQIRQDVILVCIGRDLEKWLPDQLDRKYVRILGERSDVEELLPGLDLFCLPSFAEGFPNVVGEAMASGVPCVVTDVGDARKVVGDTGWVVPPRDSDALSDALLAAIAESCNKRFEIGRLARKRIEETYSNHSLVMRYKNLYQQILTNHVDDGNHKDSQWPTEKF